MAKGFFIFLLNGGSRNGSLPSSHLARAPSGSDEALTASPFPIRSMAGSPISVRSKNNLKRQGSRRCLLPCLSSILVPCAGLIPLSYLGGYCIPQYRRRMHITTTVRAKTVTSLLHIVRDAQRLSVSSTGMVEGFHTGTVLTPAPRLASIVAVASPPAVESLRNFHCSTLA